MGSAQVLVDGGWRESEGSTVFYSVDPATTELVAEYPVSPWFELERALAAGAEAYSAVRDTGPDVIAAFLDRFAERIAVEAETLAATAHSETALPISPRLLDIELPRTIDQLRQAAEAARTRSWSRPTLSPATRIASMFGPIPGVVVVFGPNNFPFAFNAVAGGDFASAVASGHPVIAKANPGHPETTRLLAHEAFAASQDLGLHPAMVQMIYRTTHDHGARLVADRRVAATGYTGSRRGGLALKAAADAAGVPIYLEMSSVNPTVVLPGAWEERGEAIADDLVASMLLGCGQFCTNPGLVFTTSGRHAVDLLEALKVRLESRVSGVLLGQSVLEGLRSTQRVWEESGASMVTEVESDRRGFWFANTLMRVRGVDFLAGSESLQQEAFGNMFLFVETSNLEELVAALARIEGNLTGSIYAAADGSDDVAYSVVEPVLRERVGRLLNDKAPTGVAVVPAMHHGGPFPATGHPGFTAVGIPASLIRFGMLQCYDNVVDHRLPPELQAANPLGIQRLVDQEWKRNSVTWGA